MEFEKEAVQNHSPEKISIIKYRKKIKEIGKRHKLKRYYDKDYKHKLGEIRIK
jgi:hypothetical protein